jgi:hypothetical protein
LPQLVAGLLTPGVPDPLQLKRVTGRNRAHSEQMAGVHAALVQQLAQLVQVAINATSPAWQRLDTLIRQKLAN